jgi:hypothetical protein
MKGRTGAEIQSMLWQAGGLGTAIPEVLFPALWFDEKYER